MKYPKITRDFEYHVFNDSKNTFEVDRRETAKRSMTEDERKKYRTLRLKETFGFILGILFAVGGIVVALAAALAASNNRWYYILFGFGLIVFCAFAWIFGGNASLDILSFFEVAKSSGFYTENLVWEQSELEQNDIAKEWRKNHPLEEKIRKAQESKNCVDVAAVLKYCGEDLVDRIKH